MLDTKQVVHIPEVNLMSEALITTTETDVSYQ